MRTTAMTLLTYIAMILTLGTVAFLSIVGATVVAIRVTDIVEAKLIRSIK